MSGGVAEAVEAEAATFLDGQDMAGQWTGRRRRIWRDMGLGHAKPGSGPAKARISRGNRDFLQCAGQRLTARLGGDRRTDSRKTEEER